MSTANWNVDKLSDDVVSAMQALLDNIHKVNKFAQGRHENDALDYNKTAELFADLSNANACIVSKDGKVMGFHCDSNCTYSNVFSQGSLPGDLIANINRCAMSEPHDDDAAQFADGAHVMYTPVFGPVAERLGSIVLVRAADGFTVADALLAEYIAALVSAEVLRERNASIEDKQKERLTVQMAMRALSYSELESMKHIMAEINGAEGVAIASKVADRVGVTRSVIVNALRKLESAGLIESRSLGMKGTYIKVLSPMFVEELGGVTSDRVMFGKTTKKTEEQTTETSE